MRDRVSGKDRRQLVVVGGSSGVGAAVVRHFVARGADVVAVSRRPAVAGRWVQADVVTEAGLAAIVEAVGEGPLDALLYMGGVWEEAGFTPGFSLLASPPAETRRVLEVNLWAPIELTKQLAPALSRAPSPRVVLMGAIQGLPELATREVANAASKAGLRGAAAGLRRGLEAMGIGVTVLNPGMLATPGVLQDVARGELPDQPLVPLDDVLCAIELVLDLSPRTELFEISLTPRPSWSTGE